MLLSFASVHEFEFKRNSSPFTPPAIFANDKQTRTFLPSLLPKIKSLPIGSCSLLEFDHFLIPVHRLQRRKAQTIVHRGPNEEATRENISSPPPYHFFTPFRGGVRNEPGGRDVPHVPHPSSSLEGRRWGEVALTAAKCCDPLPPLFECIPSQDFPRQVKGL
ncbi:hypothetical protein TNCV_3827771 [Trichonephila clavipes]|nr:hypothetical protein TNCV_3827771 [Trichonephila clavipes]